MFRYYLKSNLIKKITVISVMAITSLLFPVTQKKYDILGKIVVKNVVDFDKDGLNDFLFMEEAISDPKKLAFIIYLNQPNREMKKVTDMPVSNINVYDLADMNGDGLLDLVYLYGKGLYQRQAKWEGDKIVFLAPIKLFSVNCLYSYKLFVAVVYEDFAFDVNADGKADFFLPDSNGILYYSSKNHYKVPRLLSAEIGTLVPVFQQRQYDFLKGNQMVFSVFLPKCDWQDVNGDGEIDLIFYGKEEISVYLVEGNDLSLFPIVYTIRNKDVPSEGLAVNNQARLPTLKFFCDVNKDKYLDLVVKRQITSARLVDVKTAIEIYYGVPKSKEYSQPDLKMIIDGILLIFPPVFDDFNGDGLTDLQDLHFELSVGKAISTFLSKQTSGYIRNFYQQKDGTFEEGKSARRLRLDMDFKAPFLFSIFSILGDYDGDGIRDLLIGDLETKKLEVFQGLKIQKFTNKPSIKIEGELFLKINVIDFDNDKKDDLLMFDPQGKSFKIIYF